MKWAWLGDTSDYPELVYGWAKQDLNVEPINDWANSSHEDVLELLKGGAVEPGSTLVVWNFHTLTGEQGLPIMEWLANNDCEVGVPEHNASMHGLPQPDKAIGAFKFYSNDRLAEVTTKAHLAYANWLGFDAECERARDTRSDILSVKGGLRIPDDKALAIYRGLQSGISKAEIARRLNLNDRQVARLEDRIRETMGHLLR